MKALLLSLAVLFTISFIHAEKEREWTSTDGRSFDGALQSLDDEGATIRRSDGQTFTVPATALSQIDQDYLDRYRIDQNRATGLSEGPFADRIEGEWIKVTDEETGLIYQIYGTSKLKRLDAFPLVIHLHGAGARATDVEVGQVEIAAEMLAREEIYDDHPALIVVPLCRPDTSWGDHLEKLEALVDRITSSVPIDRNRIYLSGYSMGARGIGAMLESRPNAYAAAMFADGEANLKWVETVDAALWLTFSGERNLAGAEEFVAAYTSAGKVAKFDGHPDHTHNQIHWTLAKTDGIWDWMYEQVRE